MSALEVGVKVPRAGVSQCLAQVKYVARCRPCTQEVGEFHLGEMVNRFRVGSLVMKLPDSDAARIPTFLFGTINGVLGVVMSLPKAQFTFLSRLQVRKQPLAQILFPLV